MSRYNGNTFRGISDQEMTSGLSPKKKKDIVHDVYTLDGVPGSNDGVENPGVEYRPDGKTFLLKRSMVHQRHTTYKFRVRDFVYRAKDFSRDCLLKMSPEPFIIRRYANAPTANLHRIFPLTGGDDVLFDVEGWTHGVLSDIVDAIGEDIHVTVNNQNDPEDFERAVRFMLDRLLTSVNDHLAETYNSRPAAERVVTITSNGEDPIITPVYDYITLIVRPGDYLKDNDDLPISTSNRIYVTPPAVLIIGRNPATGNAVLIGIVLVRVRLSLYDDNGTHIQALAYDRYYNAQPVVYPSDWSSSNSGSIIPGAVHAVMLEYLNQPGMKSWLHSEDPFVEASLRAGPWTTGTTALGGSADGCLLTFTNSGVLIIWTDESLLNVFIEIGANDPSYLSTHFREGFTGYYFGTIINVLYLKCRQVNSRSKVIAVNEQKESSKINSWPINNNYLECTLHDSARADSEPLVLADIVFQDRIHIAIDWLLESFD